MTGQNFSLLHNVQTIAGAHPASCPLGAGVLSAGVKQPVREALLHLVSRLRIHEAVPPCLHIYAWHCAWLSTRENFTYFTYEKKESKKAEIC
jgi:hypothetical protein